MNAAILTHKPRQSNWRRLSDLQRVKELGEGSRRRHMLCGYLEVMRLRGYWKGKRLAKNLGLKTEVLARFGSVPTASTRSPSRPERSCVADCEAGHTAGHKQIERAHLAKNALPSRQSLVALLQKLTFVCDLSMMGVLTSKQSHANDTWKYNYSCAASPVDLRLKKYAAYLEHRILD